MTGPSSFDVGALRTLGQQGSSLYEHGDLIKFGLGPSNMAIFLPGMKCPLCGQPINRGDEYLMFGPFVANENDPLWLFSDGAFHAACVRKHPLGTNVVAFHEESLRRTADRRCSISGALITDHNRYLGMGGLTSDSNDPLYRFNFAQFDCAALVDWPERKAFAALLTDALTSGRMKGKGVEWLRLQVENPQAGLTSATR
jgi:hypothetical protein